MSAPAPATPPAPKSFGQKLLWGCFGVTAGLALVAIVLALVFAIYARSLYTRVVADQPTVVAYQPTPAEIAAVAAKVRETDAALRRGETVSTEATAAEVNTALSTQKHLAQFKDLFTVVKLADNVATIQASVPLKIAGELKFANCEIDLYLKINRGQADYRLKQVRAKGEPLPTELVGQVEKYGLGLIKDNPAIKREIERIENFEVKAGKVLMTVKPRRGPPPPAAASDDDAADAE